MSRASIRLGFSTGEESRSPGMGRHLGLVHVAGVRDDGGRVLSVGRLTFTRRDLEPLRDKGIRLQVTVIGVLRLTDDVTPALVEAVLDPRVFGWVLADPRTKAVLTTR